MFYIITINAFLLDQLTKYVASHFLHDKFSLLGDFIYLEYMTNSGIAFGIPVPPLLLKIGTLFLILGLFYYYKLEKKQFTGKQIDVAFGLILGGALGNAFERIFYGEVIDFIGVQHFAVFNLADICINLGALLYLYIISKQHFSKIKLK